MRERVRGANRIGECGYNFNRLSAALSRHKLNSELVTGQPIAWRDVSRRNGEEFHDVVEELSAVELRGGVTVLNADDFIHFNSRIPHLNSESDIR